MRKNEKRGGKIDEKITGKKRKQEKLGDKSEKETKTG